MDWILLVTTAAALAVAANWLLFGRRRTGIAHGSEPDARAWELFATTNALAFLPLPGCPKLSGSWRGMNVRLEAEWRRADRRDTLAIGGDRHPTWYATTRIHAGIGAALPEGLHLRRQRLLDGLTDALVSGGEITVGDAAIDAAWLIHGRDPAAIAALLRDARVREPLMALHGTAGEITLDETSVHVVVPSYVSEWSELERYLGRLHALVEALREVRPRLEQRPELPRYAQGVATMKPTLTGMLQRAISAGFTATQVGRDAVAEITQRNCIADVEVERVAPYHTRTGLQQGISVIGLLTGGTARVELNFTGAAAEAAREARPGDRIIADGWVEVYDPMRNIAEVSCEAPPELRRGKGVGPLSPATSVQPQAPAAPTGNLEAVLTGMASGSAARAALLLACGGREFVARALVDTVEPTPPWRATPELLDGRTVLGLHATTGHVLELRLPPSRNDEVDRLGRGDLFELRAVLRGWDEVEARAVLEAR